MSLKNPVSPPGIDPGTVRLVAQRLNHYATPGPIIYIYVHSNNSYLIDLHKISNVLLSYRGHSG